MPWWFYVLAVLWSLPLLAMACMIAMFWWEDRRERRRLATAEDRAEAMIRRRADIHVPSAEGAMGIDLGQSGNPRARP